MSRGDRAVVSGNISSSMRANYELGVEQYYRKVGSTYRNPHFPGVQLCVFAWLNRWWEMECENSCPDPPLIFDMACGSGEVTVSVKEWWNTGRQEQLQSQAQHFTEGPIIQVPRRKASSILTHTPNLQIIAADPYTSVAYMDRTSLPCAPLSFRDIANGALPPLPQTQRLNPGNDGYLVEPSEPLEIDMVICSFALHLTDNSSELFALLWELSIKSRWFVILAPHKKPEIKDGWGWTKWNVHAWEACHMSDHGGEYLKDRVHCRIYRSLNI